MNRILLFFAILASGSIISSSFDALKSQMVALDKNTAHLANQIEQALNDYKDALDLSSLVYEKDAFKKNMKLSSKLSKFDNAKHHLQKLIAENHNGDVQHLLRAYIENFKKALFPKIVALRKAALENGLMHYENIITQFYEDIEELQLFDDIGLSSNPTFFEILDVTPEADNITLKQAVHKQLQKNTPIIEERFSSRPEYALDIYKRLLNVVEENLEI